MAGPASPHRTDQPPFDGGPQGPRFFLGPSPRHPPGARLASASLPRLGRPPPAPLPRPLPPAHAHALPLFQGTPQAGPLAPAASPPQGQGRPYLTATPPAGHGHGGKGQGMPPSPLPALLPHRTIARSHGPWVRPLAGPFKGSDEGVRIRRRPEDRTKGL
jgi:hypothetical protein